MVFISVFLAATPPIGPAAACPHLGAGPRWPLGRPAYYWTGGCLPTTHACGTKPWATSLWLGRPANDGCGDLRWHFAHDGSLHISIYIYIINATASALLRALPTVLLQSPSRMHARLGSMPRRRSPVPRSISSVVCSAPPATFAQRDQIASLLPSPPGTRPQPARLLSSGRLIALQRGTIQPPTSPPGSCARPRMHPSTVLAASLAVAARGAPTFSGLGRMGQAGGAESLAAYFDVIAARIEATRLLAAPSACDLSQARMPSGECKQQRVPTPLCDGAPG